MVNVWMIMRLCSLWCACTYGIRTVAPTAPSRLHCHVLLSSRLHCRALLCFPELYTILGIEAVHTALNLEHIAKTDANLFVTLKSQESQHTEVVNVILVQQFEDLVCIAHAK
eukprot:m.218251 g.218251  ORF g.218251 m.218251 type:complete len:112 (-) comp29525_c0_seq1:1313-1648(-)